MIGSIICKSMCLDDDEPVPFDCSQVFMGDGPSTLQAKEWQNPCEMDDKQVYDLTLNCSAFFQAFPFVYEHKFDDTFPLAFILVVEKSAEQVVRLFQSIYRPHNVYCLTYDDHSEEFFKLAMHNIARCYGHNILMPEEHHGINWGGFSILKANMKCMQVLAKHPVRWRYVQMLSWNDFPLKTPEEMVAIFKILNGSLDSELKDAEPYRYVKHYREDAVDETKRDIVKPLPPGDMYMYKGSLASALSYEFVQFVLNNEVAQNFYQYVKDVLIPEEQFWATLIHNPHLKAPGNFPGMCKHYFWYKWKRKKPWISRYQLWSYLGDTCDGIWTRKSCVFGAGDIWSLKSRPELVAHKLYLDFEPAAMYCLAELNFNRTYLNSRYASKGDDVLNLHYYQNLPTVCYEIIVDKSKFDCVGTFNLTFEQAFVEH